MTQKDRELLLKDLCARLPYGVIVHLEYDENTSVTRGLGIGSLHDIMVGNAEGKPYLRPLSSMTNEEEKEFKEIKLSYYFDEDSYILFDWLNAHHFDYRGLIERGLAIAVTENNNPYKE